LKISYIPTITDDMIGVDLLNNIMSQKTETLYKYYILETSKTVHYMDVVMVILDEQRFYLFIYLFLTIWIFIGKVMSLFFFLNFFFFLLYNIVLVWPYINMNLPQVYTCSQAWIPLPPPSPYHPSGSSHCTSPKLPVSWIRDSI